MTSKQKQSQKQPNCHCEALDAEACPPSKPVEAGGQSRLLTLDAGIRLPVRAFGT